MGSNFSSGAFKNCKDLINHDLVRVKSIMLRYEKTVDRNFQEYTFMTKQQFQWTLKLNDRQVYILWRRYDPEGFGRIPAIDVIGALALASSDNPGEKISFIFSLMDLDKDDHLSKLDLTMLLRCVTRGFSKLKNIQFPPMKTINTIINEAFLVETNELNERGEISLYDLRAFLMSNDLSRTYLANLGTEIAVVDTGKLVIQRAEVMAKLVELENNLRILKLQQSSEQEDIIQYNLERGGDASLVRLTDEAMAEFNRLKAMHADDAFENEMEARRAAGAIDGTMTEAQRMRRLKRREESTDKVPDNSLTDAAVFVSGCKPSQGKALGFDRALEQAMMFKWEILEPQSKDKLVKLDVDLVEDLFEAAGTTLTDTEAMLCLDYTKTNQLGRHSMKSILKWYEHYRQNPPTLYPPQWREFCRDIRTQFDNWKDSVKYFTKTVQEQRKIADEYERVQELSVASKKVEGDIMGAVQGSARLAAWQRQQQMDEPNFMNYSFTFGNFGEEEKEEEEEKNEDEAQTSEQAYMANVKKAREALEKEMNKWKSIIEIDVINRPEGSSDYRKDLFDAKNVLGIAIPEIEPADVIHCFSQKLGLNQGDHIGEATMWMLIDIAESATDEEAETFVQIAVNFFNTIPFDHREDLFEKVYGQLVTIEEIKPDDDEDSDDFLHKDKAEEEEEAKEKKKEQEEKEKKEKDERDPDRPDDDVDELPKYDPDDPNDPRNKKEEVKPQEKRPRRAALIALFTSQEIFRNWEEQLPPGLLISRVLRSFHFKLELDQPLSEIYEKSVPFEEFQDRLFGPQEDELGEEGMNPIRFAKLCKERVKVATDAVERADKMQPDEMKGHLRVRGLSETGTVYDLKSRLVRALKRQAEICGFGELSGFGDEMCREIFKWYDKDLDGALNMWELNSWLLDLGGETIIDQKDYLALMNELELAVDDDDNVTIEGIINYYEQYGKLVDDIRRTGIGSLHGLLKGQCLISCDYEAPAIHSFAALIDKHSVAFPDLKSLFGWLASTKDFLVEATYDKIGFAPWVSKFQSVKEILMTPGWIAKLIHKVAEYLSDGEDGLVRSMKLAVIDKFGTFGSFDAKFAKLFSEVEKAKQDQIEKDAKKKKKPNSKKDDDDGPLPTENKKDKKGELEGWLKSLSELLPPIMDSKNIKKYIQENLLAASKLRTYLNGDVLLSRTERDTAREKLHEAELNIENNVKKLEEALLLWTAHASAFYDAVRLFTSGISSIGFGSKEFYARIYLKGMDFVKYLPRSAGEPSLRRFKREDRLRRAMERKNLALAAMERERARRNMTDEEKARIKKEREEKAQQKRDEEEMLLFNECYISLNSIRDEKKGEASTRKVIESFKKLALMKEQRYPNTIKAAVVGNNYACVLKEFGHIEPAWIPEASKWSLKTAEIVQKALSEFNHNWDRKKMVSSETCELAIVKGKKSAGFLLLLQNCMTLWREGLNYTALKKYIHFGVSIHRLHGKLTKKELSTIHSERKIEDTTAFPRGDVKDQIEATLTEVEVYLAEQLAEEEAARKELEKTLKFTKERDSDSDAESSQKSGSQAKDLFDPEYLALMQRKERAKREKERKKQRIAEAEVRKESIKSRNKLYDLIATDKITEFFNKRAEDPELANEDLPWMLPDAESQDKSEILSAITPAEENAQFQNYAGSALEDASMSQLSFDGANTLDQFDSVSKLDSIMEYQGDAGFDDDESQKSPQKEEVPEKKGILSFLFRGRKT